MDRKQFVKLNGSESKNGNICCGVPQGSILSPLLFMHQAVTSSKMHHFADDKGPSKGPRIDPWGTPQHILPCLDCDPLSLTNCFRFVR